jgi:hypothetical protein
MARRQRKHYDGFREVNVVAEEVMSEQLSVASFR